MDPITWNKCSALLNIKGMPSNKKVFHNSHVLCGECPVWWMSGVVDVRCGLCLVWWMSGVVDVLFYS